MLLVIRFSKKHDGGASITYARTDGTATGQRGAHDFFVYHDIGHYAAETTLGLRRAFLGLLSEGWDLTDFGSPWPRGRFSEADVPDLMLAEAVAGALDFARSHPEPLSLAEIRESLRPASPDGADPLPVTPEQWDAIRATADALTARWRDLPPGASLELEWA
jgi:hypothetical protein